MSRLTLRVSLILAIITGLGAVMVGSNATGERYEPSFAAIKKDKGPVFREGCLIYTNSLTSPPCRYGSVGSEKKVVVFGDSHALQWTPPLIEIADRKGWELTMLMRKSCTAAIVNISPVCNKWRHNALKRIRQEKPAMVFVASNTAPGTFVMKNGKKLSRTASEPHFRKGMYETLLFLRKHKMEVTVMRDIPMSRDFVPSECVAQNRKAPGKCTFTAHRPDSEAYDYAAAKRLRAIQIIDPLPKICPGEKCRAVHGKVLKYRDRGHISATYARLLTGWLSQRLQDPFKP